MRDQSANPALPRAPDTGERAGLRVVGTAGRDGVRCPNPKCRKKLAEDLAGTLVMTCRYCNQRVTITC